MSAYLFDVKTYSYELPEALIAQQPPENRGDSRLLVCDSESGFVDSHFSSIQDTLPAGSLIVLNDTKVIPARIPIIYNEGSQGEIFLTDPVAGQTSEWFALARPLKKIVKRSFVKTKFGGCELKISSDASDGRIKVTLPPEAMGNSNEFLKKIAVTPLPPYIKRDAPMPFDDSEDSSRYQTVFAETEGAVAAPTAGLHFTEEKLAELESLGFSFARVTLCVGLGTFLPVKSSNILEHTMHEESYSVSKQDWEKIISANERDQSVICVGTTSFRAVESFSKIWSQATPESKESLYSAYQHTSLFVHPTEDDPIFFPQRVDGIITNFHQPESTLFMLVAALIGLEKAHSMYTHAIQNEYRFFSYGDACFLNLKRSKI